ncbi:hypothetical protein BKA93DRAFT_548363 [Sparassis latifolia]
MMLLCTEAFLVALRGHHLSILVYAPLTRFLHADNSPWFPILFCLQSPCALIATNILFVRATVTEATAWKRS